MLDIVRKIYMMLQMFQQSTNIYNLHVQVEIKNLFVHKSTNNNFKFAFFVLPLSYKFLLEVKFTNCISTCTYY